MEIVYKSMIYLNFINNRIDNIRCKFYSIHSYYVYDYQDFF